MISIIGFKCINKSKLDNWEYGFKSINDLYKKTNLKKIDTDVDCFLQFNIYNPYCQYKNEKIRNSYLYILESKKPVLVGEEGVFRQLSNYKRFGWNSYKNNRGIFNNDNVDDSRFKKFQKENNFVIKSFRNTGDYILIMGQVEYDSALIELYDKGFRNFNDYTEYLIKIIRKHSDRKIVFRPHPKMILNSNIIGISDVKIKEFKELEKAWHNKYKDIEISLNFTNDTSFKSLHGGKGLYSDLLKAYCVITFNSNSSVESIIEGIPTFTMDPTSPAYDVGFHDLSKIENLNEPLNLTSWLNKLVYTTWNDQEIRSGEAWDHYRSVYF